MRCRICGTDIFQTEEPYSIMRREEELNFENLNNPRRFNCIGHCHKHCDEKAAYYGYIKPLDGSRNCLYRRSDCFGLTLNDGRVVYFKLRANAVANYMNFGIKKCRHCGSLYRSERDIFNGYCSEQCYHASALEKPIKEHHYYSGNYWENKKALNQQINDKTLFYGFELECECEGNATPTEVAKEIELKMNSGNQELVVFERDGSLDNGFETITHPFTIEFIRQPQIKEKYKNMLKTMDKHCCQSHDTDTCGLHIHFTRKPFGNYWEQSTDSVNRLVYVFQKFKSELIRFSRRKVYYINKWATFLSTTHSGKSLKVSYYKGEDYEDEGRYTALNLTNAETIEVRIFRGTLKFETLMAAIELVSNIALACLELSNEEIEKMSWEDMLNYKPTEYLIPYWEWAKNREIK